MFVHNSPHCRDSAQTSFQDYGGRNTVILACRSQWPAHTDHHWKPVTKGCNSLKDLFKTYPGIAKKTRFCIWNTHLQPIADCWHFKVLDQLDSLSNFHICLDLKWGKLFSALTLKVMKVNCVESCISQKCYQLAFLPISQPVWKWFSGRKIVNLHIIGRWHLKN